ncbi:MAG: NnrU family protein [Rhodospirillales bacterium]|nr:NnrU family protein [Rhodospirillales bacterium]
MTGSLTSLLLAALAFVGGHFIVSAEPLRGTLVAQLGERAFSAVYSIAAGVLLVWLVVAYGDAPQVPLWTAPAWTRWLPVVVMPASALFLVCGLTQYNPTAVAHRFERKAVDPAPGILKITRHPMMWAMGLWALAHLPPSGNAASLILFGAIAVLALYGTTRIDAKRQARDPDGFRRFAEVTSNLPFAALLSPAKREFWHVAYGLNPLASIAGEIGLVRLTLAVALYVSLAVAHPWIAGVGIY